MRSLLRNSSVDNAAAFQLRPIVGVIDVLNRGLFARHPLLWKAKQKRQLIFTSHNANLVVNGDAELVAWCEYRTKGDQSGGKIAGEGAIDMPNVREAIKAIMEGGEAAFNLRKDKYGF